MIAASTCGFRCGHSIAFALGDGEEVAAQIDALDAVDVEQRRRQRRRERRVSIGESRLPCPSTSRPGRNFSVRGFGVDSV